MNSKKLGMIAAAALTVVAAQANAADKKAVKAGEASVCASTCGAPPSNNCGGKVHEGIKDEPACKAKNGTWMSKAEFEKKAAAAKAPEAAKAHDHAHPAPAKK
ncbi:MAG TPA: hypothetical protein VE954_25540 [Oligoflexus sp.]|uniref:hypothetical protein n=1 Tax=Oligoflexus sp. TaxID=1971216 RepID=UPI002D435462|nr:hypothetical protein [Oligoflexus sp.]HYX36485.1 hypothetical protein [Oligoflexus sp.]